MLSKQSIALIGMPGSGKTTIGKILAEKLGYDFIDIDALLIEQQGKQLSELISAVGEERFIELEAEVVMSLQPSKPSIISPGGSVVYAPNAMEHLAQVATIFYLQTPLNEIESRIGNSATRGIIGSDSKSFEELFSEREVLYKKYATHAVDNSGSDPQKAVAAILESI